MDPKERQLPDWSGDAKLQKWIVAFTRARLVLEACYLRDAMAAVQEGKGSGPGGFPPVEDDKGH